MKAAAGCEVTAGSCALKGKQSCCKRKRQYGHNNNWREKICRK